MTDARIAASYERSIKRNGRMVTIRRVNGSAPRTSLVSASVLAVVNTYAPDTESASKTGYSPREIGAITQAARVVIVLVAHLAAERFPLPVRKGDIIVLGTGEALNVVEADAETRQLAGAIEIKAAGVS